MMKRNVIWVVLAIVISVVCAIYFPNVSKSKSYALDVLPQEYCQAKCACFILSQSQIQMQNPQGHLVHLHKSLENISVNIQERIVLLL